VGCQAQCVKLLWTKKLAYNVNPGRREYVHIKLKYPSRHHGRFKTNLSDKLERSPPTNYPLSRCRLSVASSPIFNTVYYYLKNHQNYFFPKKINSAAISPKINLQNHPRALHATVQPSSRGTTSARCRQATSTPLLSLLKGAATRPAPVVGATPPPLHQPTRSWSYHGLGLDLNRTN
jgi:hypothetical protein